MKAPISISFFEDNDQLRNSIKVLFSEESDFLFFGAFPDALNIEKHVKESAPDMILMDIDMPKLSGIEALKKALTVRPETIIVMYTVFDDEDKIYDAICEGARGYVLKSTPANKLIAILKEIFEGGSYMTPAIARKALTMFQKNKKGNTDFHLTDSEKDVLQLLVEGYSYKMIAAKRFVSIDTVRSHIKNIYHKLHVNSNVDAVRIAINKGIV